MSDDSEHSPSDSLPTPPPLPRRSRLPLILATLALVFGGCGVSACLGLGWFINRADDDGRKKASRANLQQIAQAIEAFHAEHGHFPANTATAEGKLLLSWRVHLLPYLNQRNLHGRFQLGEAWDSPHNRQLIEPIPSVFQRPKGKGPEASRVTYYRGFAGPGAIFERPWPSAKKAQDLPRKDDIRDRADQTIVVIEAGEAIEWTRPEDLDSGSQRPFPPLGGHRYINGIAFALFADGQVREVQPTTPEAILRALSTHSGGEPLSADWNP